MSERLAKREMTNQTSYKNIGIIGVGRIGESLLTNLVKENENLGLNELFVYSRPNKEKEKERVEGIIQQINTINDIIPINHTQELRELGNNSDIIVITIGEKEGIISREGLTGRYFSDIKKIVEGIGYNPSLLLIATNPVTPNCLVADLYSRKKINVLGFTRIDYLRAKRIFKGWLEEEGHKDLGGVNLDILGPHGNGLLVTNIRIGKAQPIFNNEGMSLYFDDKTKTIERLSLETVKYGETTFRRTAPDGTPSVFSDQILKTLENILKGGRETVSIDVNLSDICRSGLKFPRRPTYMSIPVMFIRGNFIADVDYDYINSIPENYRVGLLTTLRNEERKIRLYITKNSNGNSNEFGLLKEHYKIN